MGLRDFEIEIDSCCLKAKYQRTKGVEKRTTSSAKTNTTNKSTDLELYKAAGEDSIQKFNDVIVRVSNEKKLPVSDILHHYTPLGNSLLHSASKFGNGTIVRHLIESDPSFLNKKTFRGDTGLHIAARFGHIGIAKALVRFQGNLIGESSSSRNGASIIGDYTWEEVWDRIKNSTRSYGISKETLLNFVQQGKESSLIRILECHQLHDMISKKYPLARLQNKKGNTPLHEAIVYRQEEVVSFLINLDQKVWFHLNKEKKSPLYLAVEAGYQAGVKVMLSHPVARENFDMWCKGKSPIHAAIRAKNKDILNTILEEEPRFIHVINQERLSPLQFAVSLGYLNEVHILLAFNPTIATKMHEDGSLPIHMASMKGHDDIIHDMLPYYPDHPMDILDEYGRNILHIAAMNGKYNVVSYILKNRQLHKLVNGRDNFGDTSLHLATKHWHPQIVSALSWYKGIDVNSTNGEECTALDIAEKSMGRSPSIREYLTWTTLKAAGASRSPIANVPRFVRRSMEQRENKVDSLEMDKYKDRVNTLLLVSTLVATVTFAAGFTMPGGYNDSEPDQGMATMLRNSKLHVFIICDTIAMYSSILVAIILIWAQLGNLNLVLNALRLAFPLLGISLTTMCVAFMVGVSLVVGELKRLNIVVLIMGLVFLVTITTFLFLLFLPISPSNNSILRYISYYPHRLLLLAIGTDNDDLHDLATLPRNLFCREIQSSYSRGLPTENFGSFESD